MSLLSKAQILAASDLKTEDVDCPEWGGTVRIQGLSGTARDAFENSLVSGSGKDLKKDVSNLRARMVGISLIDESGARLFSDAEIAALGAKSAAALSRCFDVAQRLNGTTAEVRTNLGNGSASAPSESSTSA